MNNSEKYYGVKELYCWDCGKVLEVNNDGSLVVVFKPRSSRKQDIVGQLIQLQGGIWQS